TRPRVAGRHPGLVRRTGRTPPASRARRHWRDGRATTARRGCSGLMRAWLQPMVLWGERRLPALTRYRRPESLPVTLDRRRIYIVPSGFGVGFSLLLLTMLAGALNYANNAALLLTC